MTYIELIVVLSIFSILSSVVVFNYGGFQDKVDLKNQASDIAMQIVQAQKSSLSGALPILSGYDSTWKPSYGVYFNPASDNKSFIYFADLGVSGSPKNGLFDGSSSTCTGECLSKITITKNNSISHLDACYATPCVPNSLNDLTITFSRPNSGADIRSSTSFTLPVSYVQITTTSPKGANAFIKLYPPGRVQVN